jgi:FdhE protein
VEADVARNSIARLLGRRELVSPEVAAALERLGQAVEESPSLREAAALQEAILRAIYREPPQVGTLDLQHGDAAEKLRGGVPLLRNEYVPLNMPAIEALVLQLCRAVRGLGEAGTSADAIAAALAQGLLNLDALVQEVLLGQVGALRERATDLDLDGDMLCTLLRFSLFPALEQLARQLAPLRGAATWQQGYCPTCGGWPLLGEYRGLEQTRFLRCGLCATEWAVDRLLCPFCGSRSHENLGYLYVEGDEHKRAATCDNCRGYVKMLATLAPIPAAELAIHDLATIHLDMVALERGYAAPA